jgi:hypothetical protein
MTKVSGVPAAAMACSSRNSLSLNPMPPPFHNGSWCAWRSWRAVDSEGGILDVLVQTERNKAVALKLMRKLLKKYGFQFATLPCRRA